MIWWWLGCHGPTDDSEAPDLVAELTARGPYAVGYHTTSLSYDDTIAGGQRTLRLAEWWPSNDAAGAEIAYRGVFPAPGVWLDASVADGTFPVVVFSHGHQGFAENSGFLMAHLASHGFVVLAPDHTGNTFLDGGDRATEIYAQRPLDVSAVLDRADAIPDDDPLAGHVAAGRFAIGHSFGGYTVFASSGATYDPTALACADTSAFCSTMTPALVARFGEGFLDSRIEAVIAMAPGDFDLFGDGLRAHVPPILHMTGALDPTGSEADQTWAALRKDGDLRLRIAGGGHQTFTDFSGNTDLEPIDGLIDADEGFRIIDAYALAWIRSAQGDASVAPLLDGDLVVSDAATLEH